MLLFVSVYRTLSFIGQYTCLYRILFYLSICLCNFIYLLDHLSIYTLSFSWLSICLCSTLSFFVNLCRILSFTCLSFCPCRTLSFSCLSTCLCRTLLLICQSVYVEQFHLLVWSFVHINFHLADCSSVYVEHFHFLPIYLCRMLSFSCLPTCLCRTLSLTCLCRTLSSSESLNFFQNWANWRIWTRTGSPGSWPPTSPSTLPLSPGSDRRFTPLDLRVSLGPETSIDLFSLHCALL